MHRGASLSLSFPHWEARRFPGAPCRLRLPRRLAPVGLRRSEKRARLYAPGRDVGKPAAVELTRTRLDKVEGGATGGPGPHKKAGGGPEGPPPVLLRLVRRVGAPRAGRLARRTT